MAPDPTRRPVYAVAACHFVASFAALGLPPYLVDILPTLGDEHARWAGVLYVVPTVCGAVAAPVWGRLGDRFGRKRLLLRAQLGLAFAFLLAGLAQSLPAFTGALVLQGLLGGTFAASTGYLAGALPPGRLGWALTLMQGSARAALVAAPIAVGALAPWVPPHRQYLLMALLPLAAAALLSALPGPDAEATPADADSSRPQAAGKADSPTTPGPDARSDSPPHTGTETEPAPTRPCPRLRVLLAVEFTFVFATIITFPYLTALVTGRLPELPATTAGFVFALPHVCYLLLARPVLDAVTPHPALGITAGFVLVAAGCALHLPDTGFAGLVAARLVFGCGLTAGLVGLSALTAEVARGRAPGSLFGTLEFVSKLGAVAAGLAASGLAAWLGLGAPLAAGAFLGLAAVPALVLTLLRPPTPALASSKENSREPRGSRKEPARP
ncbi:MFS transporter [Yinghuangia seranimata]|uniref:MFS transporter n=1 Tax=Yinghuangia seranimata TaxID=408067 RepID=UPI00248B0850|nr:MFS transporter [Yinghuangia seranimata]MDI2127200.1 MFS transporter [Yinghuangia seranimata]